jgi:hypothetical protein
VDQELWWHWHRPEPKPALPLSSEVSTSTGALAISNGNTATSILDHNYVASSGNGHLASSEQGDQNSQPKPAAGVYTTLAQRKSVRYDEALSNSD